MRTRDKRKKRTRGERKRKSARLGPLSSREYLLNATWKLLERARSDWHKTRLNRWLVEHKFSVMTVRWDERREWGWEWSWGGGGVVAEGRGVFEEIMEETPANKLTDMTFHALSGVEIITRQQVELSTVTLRPLKCPWARCSVSTTSTGGALLCLAAGPYRYMREKINEK